MTVSFKLTPKTLAIGTAALMLLFMIFFIFSGNSDGKDMELLEYKNVTETAQTNMGETVKNTFGEQTSDLTSLEDAEYYHFPESYTGLQHVKMFVDYYGPKVKGMKASEYDCYGSTFLAQAGFESGYGRHSLGWNAQGIKAWPSRGYDSRELLEAKLAAGDYTTTTVDGREYKVIKNEGTMSNGHPLYATKTITREEVDGRLVEREAWWCFFTSFEDNLLAYSEFLHQERYQPDCTSLSDYRARHQALQDAGYATSSTYAAKLNNTWNTLNRQAEGGILQYD